MKEQHIHVTLVDGDPNSLIIADNPSSTVRIIICPRNALSNKDLVKTLERPGVYCLIGKDSAAQDQVYIGESDNLADRFYTHRHNKEKEFWQNTVVVVSKDDNLNKAHVLYLQHLLFKAAKSANKVKVLSGQNPDKPFVSAPDRVYAERFFEQIQIILPVLGFRFTDADAKPIEVATTEGVPKKSPLFTMLYDGARATGQDINGKFFVLKGSTARIATTPTIGESSKKLREKLLQEGILNVTGNPSFWEFFKDHEFTSPSAAANVIGGASLNGRVCWKLQGTNQTYADWQDSQTEKWQ